MILIVNTIANKVVATLGDSMNDAVKWLEERPELNSSCGIFAQTNTTDLV